MSKVRLFLGTFFSTMFLCVNAQWKEPSKSIPSPNIASLGRFGDVPVSLYTGLPQIGVELFQTAIADRKLNISLAYHAQGFRADQHPGWVGNNWALQTGGYITRSIKLLPDEFKITTITDDRLGYYYLHNLLSASDWQMEPKFNGQNAVNNFYDLEPDEFSFSFLGFSGKFYMAPDGSWQVQSEDNLKVSFDGNMVDALNGAPLSWGCIPTKTFFGFTIIDANGNKYTFGYNHDAIEYSDLLAYTGDATIPIANNLFAKTWNLTKIESQDGSQVINFTYERGPFTSYLYQNYSKEVSNFDATVACTNHVITHTESISKSGRVTLPSYLAKIDYPQQKLSVVFTTSKSNDLEYSTQEMGDVKQGYSSDWEDFLWEWKNLYFNVNVPFFNRNPQYKNLLIEKRFMWLKLDKIQIINSETQEINKTIDLSYNEVPTKRLELAKVEIKGTNTGGTPKYEFEYDNSMQPALFQAIGDHWGFYNAADYPAGIIPGTDYATYRTPLEAPTKTGILTKVKYPTGGYTTFDYEINKYAKVVSSANRTVLTNQTGTAGGLRIKRITDYDALGNSSYKDYYYVKGYLYNSDINTLTSSGILNALPKYEFGLNTTEGYEYHMLDTYSNPIIPLSDDATGNHITYSEVVEKRQDNSYSIYSYSNHDNGYTDVNSEQQYCPTCVPNMPYSSRAFTRGKLLQKADYTNNGFKVAEELNTYDAVGSDQIGCRATYQMMKKVTFICQTASSPAFQQSINYTSKACYYNYYYPYLLKQQTSKIYNEGSSDVLTTSKNYIYDSYKNLTEDYFTDAKGVEQHNRYYYPYQFLSSTSTPNVFDKMLAINMVKKLVKTDNSIKKNNLLYIKAGNITNYQEFTLASSKITYLPVNSYAFESTQPVAESQIAAPTLSGNTIYADPAYYSLKTSVSYNPSGDLGSITKVNDKPVSMLYDATKQICFMADNASSADIAYTSFEDQEKGNWVYNQAAVSASFQGITGGKSFTISSTNTLQKQNLTAATNYIVSYWSKNAQPYTINNTLSIQTGVSVNGWHLYEHVISGATTVTITGEGLIDEVRLLPQNSRATSYVYYPLVGMVVRTDNHGIPTYFEYDNLNRLSFIKDYQKNIIKKYCYSYTGQSNCEVYGNDPQTSTFYSHNCDNFSSPQAYVYSVPQNAYAAASVAEANQLAQADIAANGQAAANANGTCVVTCSSGACTGIDKKCVYGNCETARKIYISRILLGRNNYEYTYVYEWSDCTHSATYTETSSTSYIIGLTCEIN